MTTLLRAGLAMATYSERDALLKGLGFSSYDDYLKSAIWRQTRRRVLNRDGGKCRCCSKAAEVVHHDSYDLQTLKGETIARLYSLCDACHDRLEFREDGSKRSMVEVQAALKIALRPIRPGKAEERPRPISPPKREHNPQLAAKLLEERRFWLEHRPGEKLPERLRLRNILPKGYRVPCSTKRASKSRPDVVREGETHVHQAYSTTSTISRPQLQVDRSYTVRAGTTVDMRVAFPVGQWERTTISEDVTFSRTAIIDGGRLIFDMGKHQISVCKANVITPNTSKRYR